MRFNEIQIINEALKQHTTGGAYPQEDMEAVGQLQHILMILGYDVGSAGVDGKYGPTTAKAVASFKRDYGVPGPGSMFGPKALAVVKKLISGQMQPKKATRVSGPTNDADPIASTRPQSRPDNTNREKGIIKNQPSGNALYTMQGASSLTKKDAAENMKALIDGPYSKMVSLFGQSVPVRDAIAKSGSSRERNTPGSQHFTGKALDLDISGFNNTERLQLVQAAREAGFKGFGFGRNTLHVDIGRNRYWNYGNSTYGGVKVARLGQYVTSGVV